MIPTSPKRKITLRAETFSAPWDGSQALLAILPGTPARQRPTTPRESPILTAVRLQALLDSGAYRTRTELATALGLSRARITQLLNLLQLPAGIRQEILTLPEEQQLRFSERSLRAILRLSSADRQVKVFTRLKSALESRQPSPCDPQPREDGRDMS